MAATGVDAQAAQNGIAHLLQADLVNALPLLNPADQDSVKWLKLAVAALVKKYAPMSAGTAGRYYLRLRTDAGLTGRPTVAFPKPVGMDQVSTVVDWATAPLYDGTSDLAATQTKLVGAADKMVLDAGRDTTIGTTRTDDKALGWARVPEPGACAFCALLATRGLIGQTRQYVSAAAAGGDSNSRFVGDGKFKSHDHCRCIAEPIFTAYEPTAQIRQWVADYTKATRGVSGSRNQRIAWRQAFEGRSNN